MTVRRHQVELARTSLDSFIGDRPDDSRDLLWEQNTGWALPFVRQIMRERHCSRIPKVIGLILLEEPDKWGHNVIIEVVYSAIMGWRAVYAATATPEGRLTDVQCYMD